MSKKLPLWMSKELPLWMSKELPLETKKKRTEGNATLPLFTLSETLLRNFTLEKKIGNSIRKVHLKNLPEKSYKD